MWCYLVVGFDVVKIGRFFWKMGEWFGYDGGFVFVFYLFYKFFFWFV